MVENRAQGILGVRVLDRQFHRFGDGDAQTTIVVRSLCQHLAAKLGQLRGRSHTFGAVGFHDRSAIGLLVVGNPNLEHRNVDIEQRAGKGQRCAPLPCTGFGSEGANARFTIVESLGNCSIRFVTARRADAFVFVEDLCRCAEGLLETMGPVQRRRPPEVVNVTYRLRDLDFPLSGHFLFNQGHRK